MKAKPAVTPDDPTAAAEDMTDAELRHEIAPLAGLLAHRKGADHAATVLARIGVALEPVRGRA